MRQSLYLWIIPGNYVSMYMHMCPCGINREDNTLEMWWEKVDRLRTSHQTRALVTLRRSFGKWRVWERKIDGERERAWDLTSLLLLLTYYFKGRVCRKACWETVWWFLDRKPSFPYISIKIVQCILCISILCITLCTFQYFSDENK